jgi:hypothetical protein
MGAAGDGAHPLRSSMAGRGPQTFKKRQKEQQRKEKREEKMAKRLQRKQDKAAGVDGDDTSELDDLDIGSEPEEVESSTAE